jgi:hypothetical protein
LDVGGDFFKSRGDDGVDVAAMCDGSYAWRFEGCGDNDRRVATGTARGSSDWERANGVRTYGHCLRYPTTRVSPFSS